MSLWWSLSCISVSQRLLKHAKNPPHPQYTAEEIPLGHPSATTLTLFLTLIATTRHKPTSLQSSTCKPTPVFSLYSWPLASLTVLVEDILRFLAHHLIQVILCNVGHSHHYSSSSSSPFSLPLVSLGWLIWASEKVTGLWKKKTESTPVRPLRFRRQSDHQQAPCSSSRGLGLSRASALWTRMCVWSARWSVCVCVWVWVRERTPSDLH